MFDLCKLTSRFSLQQIPFLFHMLQWQRMSDPLHFELHILIFTRRIPYCKMSSIMNQDATIEEVFVFLTIDYRKNVMLPLQHLVCTLLILRELYAAARML